jgi:four helix bundle protein
MDPDELENRLIDFSVRVLKLAKSLPKDYGGRCVAEQLTRSGLSVAPNYAEGRGGESRSDFAHKLKIVAKELNETLVWLKLIERAGMIKSTLLAEIKDENRQLAKIISASITTARANASARASRSQTPPSGKCRTSNRESPIASQK